MCFFFALTYSFSVGSIFNAFLNYSRDPSTEQLIVVIFEYWILTSP